MLEVNIAGISPSGLASISLLEMQLRKHFPFINQITFFRVGDVKRENIEETYDLVISTSLLPGYQGEYKLVSPILLEEDIQELKKAFQAISQKKRSAKKAPSALVKEESYEAVLALSKPLTSYWRCFKCKPLITQRTWKKRCSWC